MQNGYFQVVRTPGGYGLQIFQPKDGGEDVRLQEVMDYLDRQSIPYDPMSIKKAILAEEDAVCFLERKDCPEIEESCRIEAVSYTHLIRRKAPEPLWMLWNWERWILYISRTAQ